MWGKFKRFKAKTLLFRMNFHAPIFLKEKAPYFQCLHGVIIAVWFWNRNWSVTVFHHLCLWHLEIMEGKIIWISIVRESLFISAQTILGPPRAFMPLAPICPTADFLPPGKKLPPVTGLDTAWGVHAFQTFSLLHHWIYLLAIDLRSDYILERIGPAFETEMETSTREAEDADEPLEYDTRLWSGGCELTLCVGVLKNLPLFTAIGQSKRTKFRCLSAASICPQQTL